MSPDEEESKIPNATPMSVKDRAKHLNKMASETDIHSSKAHKHERVRIACFLKGRFLSPHWYFKRKRPDVSQCQLNFKSETILTLFVCDNVTFITLG